MIINEIFNLLLKTKVNMKSEHLGYWYLRLNGFFTFNNFIVHPESGMEQRTDIDILGVRFPFRAEIVDDPMIDDEPFNLETKRPYFAITEVKGNRCKLNGPWRNKEDQNMQRVLRAVGMFNEDQIQIVADSLYSLGSFENENYYVSLVCIGREANRDLKREYPNVPQILFPAMLGFIYHRFKKYSEQKYSHPQWDNSGHFLWNECYHSTSKEEFVTKVLAAIVE